MDFAKSKIKVNQFQFFKQKYSSKVYTCFAKVVGLVTQSTTKSGLQFLDFSTILYKFCKLLLKHSKGEEFFLHTGPRKIGSSQPCPQI
jgi:hypothetical protein